MKWIAVSLLIVMAAAGDVEAGGNVRLGVYAPSVRFSDSTEQRNYADGLARAMSEASGRRVIARVYFRYDDLVRAKPDLAIVEALCVAARKPGEVVARAVVDGGTEQVWGLYSSETSVAGLKGAKVAFPATGCRDDDFLAHAILASEMPLSFFGPRLAQPNPTVTAATLSQIMAGGSASAKAVFLPKTYAVGGPRLYAAEAVPTPALVRLKPIEAAVMKEIVGAAVRHRGKVITGWRAGDGDPYRALARRLRPQRKRPLLAPPARHQLPLADLLGRLFSSRPGTAGRPSVGHHLR